MVRGAGIEPVPGAINDCNHVGGVLGDNFEKLIALGKFATDSLELKLLVNRVDIEQEYKARQPAYPLLKIKPLGSPYEMRIGVGQGHNTRRQH
ncbi:MAG: hypothetical protein ACLPND_11325 [Candidatus Korobacteraceae bacterium]